MPQGITTFRNSKIVYYGPHPCDSCGRLIAKMGHDWGGTAFTYPDGPIYPNTEWHPHVCDQVERYNFQAAAMRDFVLERHPAAMVVKEAYGNFAIHDRGESLHPSSSGATPEAAWHCAAGRLGMPLASKTV